MRYLFLLAIVGCSNVDVVPIDDASVSDAKSDVKSDGSFGFETGADDGGDGGASDASCVPHPCPQTLPTSGSPCSGNYTCEYGSAARSSCDTRAYCTGTQWQIIPAPDAGYCAQRVECPSTFDEALDGGATCGSTNFACYYLEGTCACSSGTWGCAHPKDSACPTQRPRIGTACTGSTGCGYGQYCTALNGDVLECSCGTWEQAPPPPCPP